MQRHARETGMKYQLISPGGGAPQAADWEDVAETVASWREAMNRGLGDNLDTPLNWDEGRDAPYFTDRPGYHGWGALCLWAAYHEAGQTPPSQLSEDWMEDEIYQAAMEDRESTGKSFRVIHSVDIWLPADFQFTFMFPSLTEEKQRFGSSGGLVATLERLNEASFQMSPEQLDEARMGEFGEKPSLEVLAAYGLAVWLDLARKAHEHRLPMFFDL